MGLKTTDNIQKMETAMNPQTQVTPPAVHPDDTHIRTLYHNVLHTWNQRNPTAFAALFHPDGNSIGFDGSQVTAAYIGIIRELRFLTPDVALLRAVAGLVPPGQTDLNPATNAIQTLIAVRHDNTWRIALYQNTPAQFHGRPHLAQQLTEELRQLLK